MPAADQRQTRRRDQHLPEGLRIRHRKDLYRYHSRAVKSGGALQHGMLRAGSAATLAGLGPGGRQSLSGTGSVLSACWPKVESYTAVHCIMSNTSTQHVGYHTLFFARCSTRLLLSGTVTRTQLMQHQVPSVCLTFAPTSLGVVCEESLLSLSWDHPSIRTSQEVP